ncbi:keratin-associated protein 13-1-like [Ctenodactylus gundi]
MSYNCCSFGSRLPSSGSSCGSAYPSNLVYRTDLQSPSTCQLGSSLSCGLQETCCEPTSCHRSYVVSGPCQTSCYRPRITTFCSPCQTTHSGSLGFGSSSCYSLGYGSRSCYSSGCGSSGFRSLGCGYPSLTYGSGFCHPSPQSSCYRPTCGSGSCFQGSSY